MVSTPRFSTLTTLFLGLTAVGLAVSACGGDGKATTASDGGDGGTAPTITDSITGSGGSSSGDGTADGSSGDATSASGDATADGSTADGSSGTTDGSGGSDTTGTSSTGAGGATVLDPLELCGGVCECGNGIDDDGDGQIDGFDAECTGAADDDEGTFATGIPGDNSDPKWQDCFFDGNSGAGDDGCRYHTDCLLGDADMSDRDCTVTQDCIDFCGARTPNGCDCFGCCTVETNSGSVNVYIIDTCDLESIDDEDACPRCEPSEQCGNECGECELCPGKDTLPETCEDDTPECDGDRQPCDENTPCENNYFCQFGCCAPPPTIN